MAAHLSDAQQIKNGDGRSDHKKFFSDLKKHLAYFRIILIYRAFVEQARSGPWPDPSRRAWQRCAQAKASTDAEGLWIRENQIAIGMRYGWIESRK